MEGTLYKLSPATKQLILFLSCSLLTTISSSVPVSAGLPDLAVARKWGPDIFTLQCAHGTFAPL